MFSFSLLESSPTLSNSNKYSSVLDVHGSAMLILRDRKIIFDVVLVVILCEILGYPDKKISKKCCG